MEPWSREPVGRFDELEIESDLLRDNPLGDPHVRPLWVYMPPAYEAELDRRFPSIYVIQGMTGQLDMWRNRSAFRLSTPERIDRLFAEEGCPAAVVVFVDAWTSYGGSQFIDSPGTGRYGEYLCEEVVSFVDARYRTLADAAHRGLTGKSSGGYGAMVVPMLRPDVFGGLATHAGDALFELCYLRDFPEVVRVLRDEYDGSFDRFWEDFRSRPAFTKQSDYPLLNTWAMAACYSANEDGSIDLPFDPATGMLRDDVWQRWLAWDPVRMARRLCGCPSQPARDLHRRREEGRVLPRPRRRGLPARTRGDRDHGRLLRAFRRRPRCDRVPLPARDPLSRGAAAVACPDRGSQSRVAFTNAGPGDLSVALVASPPA